MKILFSTGCLYYLPTKEVFSLAQEAGFDGCELVIDRRFNDSRSIDTVVQCRQILPIFSIHAPFMKMNAWGNQVCSLQRSIEIAKILDAEIVNFHPPNWFSMELAFFRWFRNVQDFQIRLGGDSVILTIENMPRMGRRLLLAPYILNGFEDLIEFGTNKNLYFTFDTTHLATFGGDIIEAFLKFFKTKRLKNIHISDFGDHESHLFLGCGELPMVKFLNTIGRLGYNEMITLEVSPHELPRSREWLVKMLQYQVTFMKMHLRKECNG